MHTFSRPSEVQFTADSDDVAHGAEFYSPSRTANHFEAS
jgi:hypothetical protein